MIKNVILDMDGVVYRGERVLDGNPETIKKLKEMVNIFYLTNSASKTREFYKKRLEKMGIEAKVSEIYNSGYGVARYIKENLPEKKVFCVGDGIKKNLDEMGIETTEEWNKTEIVVAGLDLNFTYKELSTSFRAIMNGAIFLATNNDRFWPVEDGFLPGAGAIVASIKHATNKEPIVIGKPNNYILKLIEREHGIKKEETIMVGDQISTDIKMAKKEGMKSVLVLTGVSNEEDGKNGDYIPDYILGGLNELPELLKNIEKKE